ncbi:MAG: ATP synthase F1 subunit epsilon [Alphaproteobacteria bacterium]|jgi:F-type H+-transporting ATPase subunit epsilon|nr:ATP synthase F1 subunit epsilon [Candidatus Jidaibacter sp.]
MSELKLSIVTPESKLLEVDCTQVNLPGSEGVLGVLLGHMNLVSSLKPGVVEYFQGSDAKPKVLAISAGFVEISHTNCVVLVEHAAFSNTYSHEDLATNISKLEARLESAESEHEASKIDGELGYYKAIKSIA